MSLRSTMGSAAMNGKRRRLPSPTVWRRLVTALYELKPIAKRCAGKMGRLSPVDIAMGLGVALVWGMGGGFCHAAVAHPVIDLRGQPRGRHCLGRPDRLARGPLPRHCHDRHRLRHVVLAGQPAPYSMVPATNRGRGASMAGLFGAQKTLQIEPQEHAHDVGHRQAAAHSARGKAQAAEVYRVKGIKQG